jgi:2,4-dienoyl-CoA reductase-like NADH-dependent reductase (Old Yellow Enzyme family)
MARTRQAFADAARRALAAGFEVIEIHMAHGYLLQSFLSPLSNFRRDACGGSLEGRMRFPLEVAGAVRAALPDETPLFARISSEDGFEGGWTLDDSVVLARALRERGVDVIDCSSGGNTPRGATNANLQRSPGYQVPFARRIRAEAGIMSEAVGLIREPEFAEQVLREGGADLVAVGRQFLYEPFWGLHAAHRLGLDPDFRRWPHQYAWWLEKWDKGIRAREAAERGA